MLFKPTLDQVYSLFVVLGPTHTVGFFLQMIEHNLQCEFNHSIKKMILVSMCTACVSKSKKNMYQPLQQMTRTAHFFLKPILPEGVAVILSCLIFSCACVMKHIFLNR